jgi:hypothetical protein
MTFILDIIGMVFSSICMLLGAIAGMLVGFELRDTLVGNDYYSIKNLFAFICIWILVAIGAGTELIFGIIVLQYIGIIRGI